MGKRPKLVKVYATVVDAPYGEVRVGRPNLDPKNLRGWLPFVRGAWRGCHARVEWVACLLPKEPRRNAKPKR